MNKQQIPLYQCHKQVRALKIKAIKSTNPDQKFVGCPWIIVPEDPRFEPFEVPDHYTLKHNPVPGGYYVVYEDGYVSFSPAEAFEGGYSLIPEQEG